METIRERKDVPASDQWDLSVLYADPAAWDADFEEVKQLLPQIGPLQGTVGRSADDLKRAIDLSNTCERRAERLGEYAFLRYSEDVADGASNERQGRFLAFAT